MRLNVGCGEWPLEGWTNLDAVVVPPVKAGRVHVRATVPPLPFVDESLDEVYAGHFVEHLDRPTAVEFVRECKRCLKPGGVLGIVVPDTQAIMLRYLEGKTSAIEGPPGTWRDVKDLDDVCAWFFYSTIQASPHKWSYDATTLGRLLKEGGLVVGNSINRWFDPRIALGAWYQVGLEARKES